MTALAAHAGARPRTRWCGPPPYAGRSEPARTSSCAEALLAQLRLDLRRGHWRVALRHFLMLQACGCEVPPAERLHCLEFARACSGRQWRKIEADVEAWARCLGALPGRPGA